MHLNEKFKTGFWHLTFELQKIQTVYMKKKKIYTIFEL